MSSDLRRDIFRGLYNPIYRGEKPETESQPKHSPILSCWFRLPRRQNILAFLAVLCFFTFMWHAPQISHKNFLPESLTPPILITHKAPPPHFQDNPPIATLTAQEKQNHLLALARNLSSTPFPQHIYQTWKTISLVCDEAYDCQNSWFRKNPSHEYTFLTDKSALDYVVENFNASDPFIVHLFRNFPQRILAADILRYLVVYKNGGLYTDIDTECNKPVDEWLKNATASKPDIDLSGVNVVVGMELDVVNRTQYPDRWLVERIYKNRIQFLQWTLYAKPGHEIFRRMIMSIQDSAKEDISKTAKKSISQVRYTQTEILDKTGPFKWTEVIMGYINDIEGRKVEMEEYSGIEGSRKIGDVLFLPVNSWSPGMNHSHAGSDETSFVIHHFGGTWKLEFEKHDSDSD
ncbi:membrane-bound alpha-1,6- mannosyltransferase Initiation-specific [Orbilia ellipsospora]|uniref:Membrane-bound alpha-1,6- mannosyltransferase Initiation-specific n=1 Tax=Orbilia ellipsospora TaxID=2528407 RepID=A0AAV9X1P8_9PEZI